MFSVLLNNGLYFTKAATRLKLKRLPGWEVVLSSLTEPGQKLLEGS